MRYIIIFDMREHEGLVETFRDPKTHHTVTFGTKQEAIDALTNSIVGQSFPTCILDVSAAFASVPLI